MLPSTDLKASAPRTIAFPVLNSPAHPCRYRRFACPLAGTDARLAEKRGSVTPSFRGTCTPYLLPVRLAHQIRTCPIKAYGSYRRCLTSIQCALAGGGAAVHRGRGEGQIQEVRGETPAGRPVGSAESAIVRLGDGHNVFYVGLARAREMPPGIGAIDPPAHRRDDAGLDRLRVAIVPALVGRAAMFWRDSEAAPGFADGLGRAAREMDKNCAGGEAGEEDGGAEAARPGLCDSGSERRHVTGFPN